MIPFTTRISKQFHFFKICLLLRTTRKKSKNKTVFSSNFDFSFLLSTLSHTWTHFPLFHILFFEARRQFLKHGPSLSPKDLSKALLDRSIEHLSLFARGKIRGFFFFSPHQFQFLFSQFPTCGVVGRKVRRRESFHLVYRGTSIAAASRRLQFWSRGGAFRTAFRRHFRPTPRLLLLNVPSPSPPSARPSPLIAFIAPLSSDTFARKSFLIDNRRLATSVSGECFSPNCVSTNVDCVFDSLPCGQISRSR